MNRILASFLITSMLPVLAGCEGRVSIRQAPAPSTPVSVKVVRAHLDAQAGSYVYVGTVSASKSVTILAPAPGTLKSLSVREGSRVNKGEMVGCISSEAIQSSNHAAVSRLSQAEDGLKRAESVYQGGAVSEVEYINIKTQVEEARAAAAATRDALEKCTLKAPFNGVVGEVWPAEGTEVTLAQPILSILDLNSLEVHFSLPENEYRFLREGTPVKVEIPALGNSTDGKLSAKGISASALSRSYDCTVSIPSGVKGLMPGMVCKIRVESRGNVCAVIPSSAVMTDTRGRYVWTATGGVVDKKYVTVNGFSGDGVVISEGLEEDDLVIIKGARRVSGGMKVDIVE